MSTSDAPVLWLPPETPVRWPALGGRPVREASLADRYTLPWDVIEDAWTGEGVLILGRPGRAHSLWLFWEDESFLGWYVNLEEPWTPSAFGFDTQDHELDLWVSADGSWHWKDEHELAVAVELDYFSEEHAASFRAEGERVVAEWPFPTGWEDWRPDPSWPVPSLPTESHAWH